MCQGVPWLGWVDSWGDIVGAGMPGVFAED